MSDTVNLFSREDMIRKVAALLETAQSFADQGNEEAAGSYVQKAHALQQKYSIDAAMLEARTGQKTEQIISKTIRMTGAWGKRKVTLAHVIAHATHCTGYYSKNGSNYSYIVFGFESDVDHVEFLINHLSHQLDRSLAFAQKNKPSWEHGKSFNASFCIGFTNVIRNRLRAAEKQATVEAAGESLTGIQSVAMVLVEKKARVEKEMRAQVPNLSKGSGSTTTSGSGYSAGREAGSRATIARGSVSGGSKGSLGR